MPDKEGKVRCVHIQCGRKYPTLEDLRRHVITSKAKFTAESHEWLERLMGDTFCPFLNCDFKGRDLEEMFVHMFEVHKWQWRDRDTHAYSSKMSSNVRQSTLKGKERTFELDGPPNFGDPPSLRSEAPAYTPAFAAEETVPCLTLAPSVPGKIGKPFILTFPLCVPSNFNTPSSLGSEASAYAPVLAAEWTVPDIAPAPSPAGNVGQAFTFSPPAEESIPS